MLAWVTVSLYLVVPSAPHTRSFHFQIFDAPLLLWKLYATVPTQSIFRMFLSRYLPDVIMTRRPPMRNTSGAYLRWNLVLRRQHSELNL
jgi:hypothetical protein